ncbi:hypothetical protein FQN53_006099 [Emmonsiellopsis sp. PD_33]|nr:hypothetical protein FQN53_006099 [Emmonsiellopsis sp. PD_33]
MLDTCPELANYEGAWDIACLHGYFTLATWRCSIISDYLQTWITTWLNPQLHLHHRPEQPAVLLAPPPEQKLRTSKSSSLGERCALSVGGASGTGVTPGEHIVLQSSV